MSGNHERTSGAIDQEAFENVIRDNLSPAGVAAIIAFLRVAESYQPANAAAEEALRQVAWLADTLLEMLSVDEYNRLLDEVGL